MKVFLILLALALVLTGCSLAEQVQTALANPQALEAAIATDGPITIDGVEISDEAAAIAIGLKAGADKAVENPTLPGLIGALAALVTAGGAVYLRRKLRKRATASVQ